MKKKSPMLRLLEFGEEETGRLIRAVLSASLGVLFGMLPYLAAAKIIIALLNGNRDAAFYFSWCGAALLGYLLRSLLYVFALSMSHKATFSILKHVREQILDKLPRMPLGTIIDTSSGQLKQIIVDQVESMERPLAHLLPEMTSNLLGPLCILIYLFILDEATSFTDVENEHKIQLALGKLLKGKTAIMIAHRLIHGGLPLKFLHVRSRPLSPAGSGIRYLFLRKAETLCRLAGPDLSFPLRCPGGGVYPGPVYRP